MDLNAMYRSMTREEKMCGASVECALTSIRNEDDRDVLESCLLHERGNMNRVSVLKALEARIRKLSRT